MAAYFGRSGSDEGISEEPAVPAFAPPALAELGPEEDDEEDDLAASFSLPLRRAPVAADPFADFDEPVNSAEEDPDYGSLLSLRNPFQAKGEEFVRVEEPEAKDAGPAPAVIFPGREPAATTVRPFDPPAAEEGSAGASPARPAADGEADEALRRALATLQRMSQSA